VKLSIIIPAYNEERHIRVLLGRVDGVWRVAAES
jgi:glycosyltransferase involved in cell wall biosynthesis